jgi:hypothetical protein
MSSTASYDVILSSSGVRISFAMCVTFLGRGESRGESGGFDSRDRGISELSCFCYEFCGVHGA